MQDRTTVFFIDNEHDLRTDPPNRITVKIARGARLLDA